MRRIIKKNTIKLTGNRFFDYLLADKLREKERDFLWVIVIEKFSSFLYHKAHKSVGGKLIVHLSWNIKPLELTPQSIILSIVSPPAAAAATACSNSKKITTWKIINFFYSRNYNNYFLLFRFYTTPDNCVANVDAFQLFNVYIMTFEWEQREISLHTHTKSFN